MAINLNVETSNVLKGVATGVEQEVFRAQADAGDGTNRDAYTEAERDQLDTTGKWPFIYNTDSGYYEFWNGTEWKKLRATSGTVWNWDTSTVVADPGSGDMRADATSWGAVVRLMFSETDSDGLDVTILLNTLGVGSEILMQQENDSTQWGRFTVSGAPVDNGTWWSMTVTLNDSGGVISTSNQTAYAVIFSDPPAAAQSTFATYADAQHTAATPLVVNNASVQITNDGQGADTNTSGIPSWMADLWDVSTGAFVLPDDVKTCDVRVTFKIANDPPPKSADLVLSLDGPPAQELTRRTIQSVAGVETSISEGFTIPAAWLANAKFHLDSTNSGDDLEIFDVRVFIANR